MPDPLAVLLLPARLEEFAHAEHARDLLRAPRVVALEPPRVSFSRLVTLPAGLALRAGLRQAKRLKLPGAVRVVVLYDPLQALMAFGLLSRYREAELWYLPGEHAGDEPAAKVRATRDELDGIARRRAALLLPVSELATRAAADGWFDANEPLWDRLEELEIAQFTD